MRVSMRHEPRFARAQALPFAGSGFRDELVLGCGIEVLFGLHLQRWLIAFQRKHEIVWYSCNFIAFFRHAELCQRQLGVGCVSAERVQSLQSLALAVCAA